GLSNVAEVGFTVWLKHKKINVSNSRVSKLLIVPTDVLRQHEIVTTDVVAWEHEQFSRLLHQHFLDIQLHRIYWKAVEFVNEAALVKSVKVVAECLAGLSNVAEVGFTVWLKHKKINVSNSRVSKLLIVPTDVLRQHEIVTTDVVAWEHEQFSRLLHQHFLDIQLHRIYWKALEFVNEAALVKSVKVVAECLAVRLIFVIILTLSATGIFKVNKERISIFSLVTVVWQSILLTYGHGLTSCPEHPE
ncbi:hypothetical protein Tco_1037295, partial [Tanacetum coccineum]